MDEDLIFDSVDVDHLRSSTTHLLINCSTNCKLAFREYCSLVLRNRSSKKRIFEWVHQLFARLAGLTHELDIHKPMTVIPSFEELESLFIPCSLYVSNLKKLTTYWEECSYDELYSMVLLLDYNKDGYVCWNDHMTFVVRLEGNLKQRRPSLSVRNSPSASSLLNSGSNMSSPDVMRKSASGASLASGHMTPTFYPVSSFSGTGGTDSSNNSRSSTPSYSMTHTRTGSGGRSPSLTTFSGSHGSPLSVPGININPSSGYDALYSELREQLYSQDSEYYARFLTRTHEAAHDIGNRLSSLCQIFLMNQHSDVVGGLVGSYSHGYERSGTPIGHKFSPMRSIMREATHAFPQKHGRCAPSKKPLPLPQLSVEFICRLLLRLGGILSTDLMELLGRHDLEWSAAQGVVHEPEPVPQRNPSFVNYESAPMSLSDEHGRTAGSDHSSVYSISTADTSINTSNISGVNSRHSRVYSSVSEDSVDPDEVEVAPEVIYNSASFDDQKRQQRVALKVLDAQNESDNKKAQVLLRRRGGGAAVSADKSSKSSPKPAYDPVTGFGGGKTNLTPTGARFPIPSVVYMSPSPDSASVAEEEEDDDVNENDISGISTDDSIGRRQGPQHTNKQPSRAEEVASLGSGQARPVPFSPFQRRPNSPSFAARRFSTTGKNLGNASPANKSVGHAPARAVSGVETTSSDPPLVTTTVTTQPASVAGQNKAMSAVEALRMNVKRLTDEMMTQQADISSDKALLSQVEHLLEGIKGQQAATGANPASSSTSVSSVFPNVDAVSDHAVKSSSDSVHSAVSGQPTVDTGGSGDSESSALANSCFLTQQSPDKVSKDKTPTALGRGCDDAASDSAVASTIGQVSQQSESVDGGGFFLTQETQFHAPKREEALMKSHAKATLGGIPDNINMKVRRRSSHDHSLLQSDNISTMSYISGAEGSDAYDYGYRPEQYSFASARGLSRGRPSVGNGSMVSANVNTSNVSHIKAHIFRSPVSHQVSNNKNHYSRADCTWKPKPTAKTNKYNDRFTDVALTNHIRKMNSVLYR